MVLVQGHPEYDPSSLVREYHRDVRRYAGHERDEVPCLPASLRGPRGLEPLQRLQERLARGERDPALVESFPFDEAGARATWPWRGVATRLYGNLLAALPKRSG